ncbi:MAG: Trp family transcriptional regulator [Lentisphaeria bacterium]|jgi:TrpR family trp operon transcriptional repressor|nr:Trp family transcriptional regulator [Lentisphaeria bacterium]
MHKGDNTLDQLAAQLANILVKAKSEDEMRTLINGLLAPQELEEVVLRWELIEELLSKRTQREISERLGVSLGKIARGSRLIKYGPPEFRTLVQRIQRELGE